MSYNKQTSLAANVEAIETAVKIHVQGRKAMAKEKETLSRYSGFGGIKEVLNIGTDNPLPDNMAEPMNRLQKALRTLAGGEETMYRKLTDSLKASVLTAFYTPQFLVDAVARQIRAAFTEYGLPMRSLLEPSAGIGGVPPPAPPPPPPPPPPKQSISGLILSLLHDDTTTVIDGFETIGGQDFGHTTFDVIASNIPFGDFRVFDADLWKKGGIYERSTKTIHTYFFVKAMEQLAEGGLLAFVTSRGVADTPGNKFVREYLVGHADLISAIRLPDALFLPTSGIEVGSDLLVFQKHTGKAALSLREKMFLQSVREKADATGIVTEPANRLFSLPKTSLATDSRIVVNRYGKQVRKYQWLGDEAAMSQYLSALLRHDFARSFRKELFSGGAGDTAPVQMSLFGMPAAGATRPDRGRRAYTGTSEEWMKDGAMVAFEGQVGTLRYRKSDHYEEVAVDFVPEPGRRTTPRRPPLRRRTTRTTCLSDIAAISQEVKSY